jgi:anaerobic magnesium-protoporphyrin IX monomethyl ester cyclase
VRRVLLLFPPFTDYGFGDQWKGTESLTPPLGLLYLAGPLVERGYHVKLLDLSVERATRTEFQRVIAAQDFILISCYTQTLANVRRLIDDIRDINGHAFILCGGPYCRETRKYIRGSDLTSVGEAERTIVTMLERLECGHSLREIPDIAFEEHGEIVSTAPAPGPAEFQDGRWPLLELTRGKDYGYFQGVRIPKIAPLLTSRGCPFRCRFCTWNFVPYRERPVADVMDEIRERVRQGYRYLVLCDDNFLLKPARVHELMDEILARGIKIKMIVQGRVDAADAALYEKMRRAGVLVVIYGIESANLDVLQYYNKRSSEESIRKAIVTADRVGLVTVGSFIIGAPIETRAHFLHDREFADELPLDFLNVNVLSYFHGSGIWQEAHEKGLLRDNDLFVLADERLSQFTHEELTAVQSEWLNHFYLQPKRLARMVRKILAMGEARALLMVLRQLVGKTLWSPGGDRYGFFEGTVRVAAEGRRRKPLATTAAQLADEG